MMMTIPIKEVYSIDLENRNIKLNIQRKSRLSAILCLLILPAAPINEKFFG